MAERRESSGREKRERQREERETLSRGQSSGRGLIKGLIKCKRIYLDVYIRNFTYICNCVYEDICLYVYIRKYTYMCNCVYEHICLYVYIHIHVQGTG